MSVVFLLLHLNRCFIPSINQDGISRFQDGGLRIISGSPLPSARLQALLRVPWAPPGGRLPRASRQSRPQQCQRPVRRSAHISQRIFEIPHDHLLCFNHCLILSILPVNFSGSVVSSLFLKYTELTGQIAF